MKNEGLIREELNHFLYTNWTKKSWIENNFTIRTFCAPKIINTYVYKRQFVQIKCSNSLVKECHFNVQHEFCHFKFLYLPDFILHSNDCKTRNSIGSRNHTQTCILVKRFMPGIVFQSNVSCRNFISVERFMPIVF